VSARVVQRLATSAGAIVTHEALVHAAFGPAAPVTALGRVQQAISRLRALWPGAIETYHGTGYRLRPESELAKTLPPIDDRRSDAS